MSRTPDVQTSRKMYAFYQQGHSLTAVAIKFNVTRQNVWERLHRQGLRLRKRSAPSPFLEHEGVRYSLLHSGHYAGYYRKTSGDREMLHRAIWRKHHGPIKRGHDVKYIDGDKTNNAIENLDCLPHSEGQSMYAANRVDVKLKRCIACGEPMGRRFGWNAREAPTQYAKRKTCNVACSARWKKGKKRGAKMPT